MTRVAHASRDTARGRRYIGSPLKTRRAYAPLFALASVAALAAALGSACLSEPALAPASPARSLAAPIAPSALAAPNALSAAPFTALALSRPGPGPRGRSGSAAAMNAQCEACHVDIAAEWRSSSHRSAYVDPMVQSQLEREPFAFCVGCHAPESDAARPLPSALGDLGVACVTCHVVDGQILASPLKPASPSADIEPPRLPPPHAVVRADGFGGAFGCAACHEFAFPDAALGARPLLMQSTMSEHAASAYADASCASCHMPVVAGRRERAHTSHLFAASRDEAAVRSAVRVEAAPSDGNTLVLTLRAGAVGHAFPTGDMLRRIALVLEVVDAEGRPVQSEIRYFQRYFGFVRRPFTPPRKVLVKDARVGAGLPPAVVRFTPRVRPAGGQIRYSVRYERVSDPSGGAGGEALVEGSILLAEGAAPLFGALVR